MFKGLMIILDGLGDRPNPELQGLTPLEAAHTPVMDRLLANGSCGLVDTLSIGMPVDTHTGGAALMGIDRNSLLLLDRGPVEAAGVGIKTITGDILLRANFATVEDDGVSIIDRRAGRITRGTDDLAKSLQDIKLNDGISASLYPANQHRAIVRLRGNGLSPDISDTDPCRMFCGAKTLSSQALDPKNNKAINTARALNKFTQIAFSILTDHPVNKTREFPGNSILTRGAGQVSIPLNLLQTLGLDTVVISGDVTFHGLAQIFGFDLIYQQEFTAAADTDLDAKILAVNRALNQYDMVYLHIKATDIFSHNKDARGKMIFLEAIDQALDSLLADNLVIGIVADHSTDCISGNHIGDPVPGLLSAPSCRIDKVLHFSEIDCFQGGLGRINASGFLISMLDIMGRLQNYRPSDIDFFTHT